MGNWELRKRGMFLLAFFIVLVLPACEQQVANRDSAGKNIICFGDSLTEGYGANAGEDYPAVLSEMLGRPIINAGVRGDTTRDALSRTKHDVLEKDPFLVIVALGGNDFLKGIPQRETLENIEKIVSAIQEQGAMVVLAKVKVGLMKDRYFKGFHDIAKRRKVVLIPDIMKGIMFNPALKYDGIHPNAAGYKIMAERVYPYIKPFLR